MKKIAMIMIIALLTNITGCTEEQKVFDYDLTEASATIVFSQVYDMLVNPDFYEDKTFKIEGECQFFDHPITGERLYFVVVMDALGCCPQGIEVMFNDGIQAPEKFCNVIIEGTGATDVEFDYTYLFIDVEDLQVTA
ncbi:MAG: hypothetical protein R3Y12_00550 [Clostridia bacterium]